MSLEESRAEPAVADNSQGNPETPVEIAQRYLNEQANPTQKASEDAPAEETVEESAADADTPEEEGIAVDPDAKVFEIEGQHYSLNELSQAQKSVKEMQADYTRKTTELARQREQLPLEVHKQVQQTTQAYTENLKVLQRAVSEIYSKELASVNWNTLAEENPAEFVKLSARANQMNTILTATKEELERTSQEQAQAQAAARQAAVQTSLEMLPKVIPGWDEKVYQEVLQQGVKFYGLDPKEISQVVDWQIIHALHDAVQYRKLQDTKGIAQKKVVNAPKMLKPGSAQPAKSNSDEISKLKARAKNSGSKEDAVALVARLMKG